MELRSGTVTGGSEAAHPQPPRSLSQESLIMFQQGVGLVLSRWTALQLAIQNEWGGPSSQHKAQQLHADIVAWMNQSKVQRYIDELEDVLDENMLLSFNTEIEDGSLEEVAEQIMSIYEECLEGNFESIRHLSTAPAAGLQSVSRSQQLPCEDDENETINDSCEARTSVSGILEGDEMDVENNQSNAGIITTDAVISGDKEGAANSITEEVVDGWQVVSSKHRRNHRKR